MDAVVCFLLEAAFSTCAVAGHGWPVDFWGDFVHMDMVLIGCGRTVRRRNEERIYGIDPVEYEYYKNSDPRSRWVFLALV